MAFIQAKGPLWMLCVVMMASGCGKQSASVAREQSGRTDTGAATKADTAAGEIKQPPPVDVPVMMEDSFWKAKKVADEKKKNLDAYLKLQVDPRKLLPAIKTPTEAEKRTVEKAIQQLQTGEPGAPCVFNEQCQAPLSCVQETECRLLPCARIKVDSDEKEEGEEPDNELLEEVTLDTSKRMVRYSAVDSPFFNGSVIREFVYDHYGRVFAEFFDCLSTSNRAVSDGEPDQFILWQYDAQSRLVKKDIDGMAFVHKRKMEPLFDGKPDAAVIYEYNDANRLIHKTIPADNSEDAQLTWHYQYNLKGQVANKKLMSNDTQKLLELAQYRYDNVGRLVQINRDSDGDGALDWWRTIAYSRNRANNPVKTVKTREDVEGNLDAVNVFEYDAQGRLVKELETLSLGADIDPVTNTYFYNYDCYTK
ncbi:MAG: hypothetical protein JXX14_23295 [Deltaproteobacteria bacterium]|nr:hypothetical protein [Deltaproteobacteria bacterium]